MSPWYDIISPVTISLTEDGRLVSLWLSRDSTAGDGDSGPLLAEQWLTTNGVSLVRDEIVGTGLFGASAEY